MNILGKRGLVLGLFVLAVIVVTLSLVSAACFDITTTVRSSKSGYTGIPPRAQKCGMDDITTVNGTTISVKNSLYCASGCGGTANDKVYAYKCTAYGYTSNENTAGYEYESSSGNGCSITGVNSGINEPYVNFTCSGLENRRTHTITTRWCEIPFYCAPNCTDKQCGDDGCGGICGRCTGEDACNSTGQCAYAVIDNDQTILRLSAQTDAYGANATVNSYIYDISYGRIFGVNSFDSNPHKCTANNTILKLSKEVNALAYAPNASGAFESICYGNLTCALKENCAGKEKEVVALSNTTMAKLAAPGKSNYTYKICCTGKIVREYNWTNLNNVRINGANVGMKVKLNAKTGLNENVSVNFTIYEDDGSSSQVIMKNIIIKTDKYGSAAYLWTITEGDMDKAGVGSGDEGNTAEFYFIASYAGKESNDTGRSGILTTSSEVFSCNSFFTQSGEENIIEYCDNYNYVSGTSSEKQNQCEQDCNNAFLGDREVISENLSAGRTVVNDGCEWSSSASKCIYAYDLSSDVSEPPVIEGRGSCKQTADYSTACKEGYRKATFTYKKVVNGVTYGKTDFIKKFPGTDWGCADDRTIDVPCPSSVQAILPFFGIVNLASAMSIIALVYVLFLFKKEFN